MPDFHPSSRLASVPSPMIPIIGALIAQHPGTISLGQGVVYYGPPPQARQRMAEFFTDPENNKYQPVHGIPPLVQAWQATLARERGVEIHDASRRLVVTAGGNMAFANAILALADPGDEVILLTPYYFN